MNNWNKQQKINRLNRDIAHFTEQIERFSDPHQSSREKAALTLSQRKLAQRRKLLESI